MRHLKICPVLQVGGGKKRSIEEEASNTIPAKQARKETSFEPIEVESALKRALVTYRINLAQVDDDDVFKLLKEAVLSLIKQINENRMTRTSKGIKFFMVLEMEFFQASNPEIVTVPPIVFHSETHEVYEDTNLEEVLQFIYREFTYNIGEYQRNGSGWVVKDLLQLDTTVLEFDPLRASGNAILPKKIRDKKACINVKSNDKRCFLWNVIAGIHPSIDRHVDRVCNYKEHEHKFNVSGLDFPMQLNKVEKFEELNDVSVSVYGYDDEKETVFPLRVSRKVATLDGKSLVEAELRCSQHVDLLMFADGKESHYALIKNFSRLVCSQVNKHNGAMHFCRFCLHGFTKKKLLDAHIGDCSKHEPQRTMLPNEMTVKFKAIKKQLTAPFVCYADFECTLDPLSEPERQGACKMNEKMEPQTKYQQHKPASFAYKIVPDVEGFYHDMNYRDLSKSINECYGEKVFNENLISRSYVTEQQVGDGLVCT